MPCRNNNENAVELAPNGDSGVENNNNNDDNNNTDGYLLTNRSGRKQKKIYNNDADNANDDAESWHILDADEDSDRNARSDSISKDVIEISPKVEDYSPALVKICAALYALVPVVGFIATHYLLFLLFTRHWFVTVLYVLYLLWDKQTCNRGKW